MKATNASINGKFYHLHRLVWFYSTGAWPIGVIDHVNRDRADNRISNLETSPTHKIA